MGCFRLVAAVEFRQTNVSCRPRQTFNNFELTVHLCSDRSSSTSLSRVMVFIAIARCVRSTSASTVMSLNQRQLAMGVGRAPLGRSGGAINCMQPPIDLRRYGHWPCRRGQGR